MGEIQGYRKEASFGKLMNYKKINTIILLISLTLAGYLILTNTGRILNSPYGAGDYYYTDISNFKNLFFSEDSINLGTAHPLAFFSLFIAWGVFCWYILKWLNKQEAEGKKQEAKDKKLKRKDKR